MTREEMDQLIEKYFDRDGYVFPREFEFRVDDLSSKMLYSMIRDRKPTTVLEIGTWFGGSTCVIHTALQKNGGEFMHYASELLDDLREKTAEHVEQHCGDFPIMLGDITKILEELPEVIDFLFVDTDHDRAVTEWIAEHLWPRLKKGAIFSMHDWAVEEKDGELIGKGAHGTGALPEAQYLMDLQREGAFPFKRVFWTWHNPGNEETAFWEKI